MRLVGQSGLCKLPEKVGMMGGGHQPTVASFSHKYKIQGTKYKSKRQKTNWKRTRQDKDPTNWGFDLSINTKYKRYKIQNTISSITKYIYIEGFLEIGAKIF